MPDESIDLVLTSPPYDDLREYDGYSFNFEDTASQIIRVLKPGAVCVWVVADSFKDSTESCHSMYQALWFKEHGLCVYDTMIWIKPAGGACGSNRAYRSAWEYMFVFSKGKPKTVNLIADVPNRSAGQRHIGRASRGDPTAKMRVHYMTAPFVVRPNYWYMSPQPYKGHPATFPEALTLGHIQTWSDPADVVLDPFMGSGTSAKAARILGRSYIGFEVSSNYVKIAEERCLSWKLIR